MQGGIAIVERLSGARAWVALRGSCLLCFMAVASRTLLRVKDGGTVGKLWANDGKGGSGVSMWSKSESSVVVCALFLKPSSPRRAERQITVFCYLCESTGCFTQRWRGAVLRRDGRSIDLGFLS